MFQLRKTNRTPISKIQKTSRRRQATKRSPRRTSHQTILLPSTNPRTNRHTRTNQQIQEVLINSKQKQTAPCVPSRDSTNTNVTSLTSEFGTGSGVTKSLWPSNITAQFPFINFTTNNYINNNPQNKT